MPHRYLFVEQHDGSFFYRRNNGLFERTPSRLLNDSSTWEPVRIVDLPLEVFGALFDAVTDIFDLPMTTIYNTVCKWTHLPEVLAEQYRLAFAECSRHILCNDDIEHMWFVVPDSFVCKSTINLAETKESFNGILAHLNAGNLQVGEGCICTINCPDQHTLTYSPNIREITCKHISLNKR